MPISNVAVDGSHFIVNKDSAVNHDVWKRQRLNNIDSHNSFKFINYEKLLMVEFLGWI